MVIDFNSSYTIKNGEPQFHAEMDANFGFVPPWASQQSPMANLM